MPSSAPSWPWPAWPSCSSPSPECAFRGQLDCPAQRSAPGQDVIRPTHRPYAHAAGKEAATAETPQDSHHLFTTRTQTGRRIPGAEKTLRVLSANLLTEPETVGKVLQPESLRDLPAFWAPERELLSATRGRPCAVCLLPKPQPPRRHPARGVRYSLRESRSPDWGRRGEAIGPRTMPARIKAPPTPWSQVRLSPRRRNPNRPAKTGSMVNRIAV